MLASAWEQCRECHALVLTLPTLAWGLSIAEALGVPAVAALLQPVGRTAAFASPLLPTRRSLGAALNCSSHDLIARTLWMPWRATINRWRRTRLGLAPIGAGGPLAPAERSGMPTLYGYSAQVLPAPPDWPDWRVVTGYWFLETPCGWTPPEKLARFVVQGSRPVYVGFGSMGAPRPELGALVVAALRQLGLRGILSLGPTLPPEQYGADMLCVGPTWHDWLFGHVDVVVHHGGAGTAAAGMRAGIPAIVAPVGVDQFFWAGRIAALGCGVDAGALYGLTRAGLVTALERACAAPVRARAAQLGAQLAAEDGIARAIAVLAASGRAAA
jgi:UDP:flavonoid glycosyltransferase YjiC (YdhE family)